MTDDPEEGWEDLLAASFQTWTGIRALYEELVAAGEREAILGGARLLEEMAADLRSRAEDLHNHRRCRDLLVTDADRYETTAMDLRLGA